MCIRDSTRLNPNVPGRFTHSVQLCTNRNFLYSPKSQELGYKLLLDLTTNYRFIRRCIILREDMDGVHFSSYAKNKKIIFTYMILNNNNINSHFVLDTFTPGVPG